MSEILDTRMVSTSVRTCYECDRCKLRSFGPDAFTSGDGGDHECSILVSTTCYDEDGEAAHYQDQFHLCPICTAELRQWMGDYPR